MRVAALAATIALAACFNPTFDNPTCGPNGECPSGTTCVQNVCRSSGDGVVDAMIDMAPGPDPDAMTDGTPIDMAIDAAPQCASGDLQSQTDPTRCFRKLPSQHPWGNARIMCQSLGGELADIRNTQENMLVSSLASGEGQQIGVWLGGTDMMIEMDWRWVTTGMPIMGGGFESWALGEPNSGSGPADDCMRMDQAGQWFDTDCNTQARKPICLMPPI